MHGYLFDPLTSRPKSQMFFRRMQQDRDFPTETHQNLVLIFLCCFSDCINYGTSPSNHHLGKYVWNFFQASEANQKNDDLTSEYLKGHVPKKTTPASISKSAGLLVVVSFSHRQGYHDFYICIYCYLELLGDSEIGTTPRFRSISGTNQLEAVSLEVVVATIFVRKMVCVDVDDDNFLIFKMVKLIF